MKEIRELKAHAGDESITILTQLAKDSIQNGQVDTLHLLKEAGVDANVIATSLKNKALV